MTSVNQRFGVEEWKKYSYLDFNDVPEIPAHLQQASTKEGHKLYLIPEGVNVNNMERLLQDPKSGHANRYFFPSTVILDEYGHEKVSSSYWAVMTTRPLPNNYGKNRFWHQEYTKANGYEVPSLLEAIVCCFTTYVQTKERLFTTNDFIDPCAVYTCCKERRPDGKMVVLGYFSPDDKIGLSFFETSDITKDVGVAGILK